MNVLFVYPNLTGGEKIVIGFNIGIATLSAVLKEKGHKVRLIQLNEALGKILDLEKIKDEIQDFKPGLIAISVSSAQLPVAVEISKYIKEQVDKNLPILFGGPHPTMQPDDCLNNDYVDMAIVGEAEGALLELVGHLEKEEDISQIPNLWVKKDGKVIKNRLRAYVNLNEVPFMDVSLCDYQQIIDMRHGWIDVMLNRGCPYQCTYCFNKSYNDLYKRESDSTGGYRDYLRTGNFVKTIEGIRNILQNYKNVKCVSFVDDDFLIHAGIIEFMRAYKKEIGLPYVINTNMLTVTEEKVKELAASGCDIMRMGVESGNEMIRKTILKRFVSDEIIINTVKMVRAYGIKAFTYNIIGLPTETKEDIIKTLKLNLKCGTDIVKVMTLYPFRGTEMFTIAEDYGLVDDATKNSNLTYYDPSLMNFSDEFKLFVEMVQKYFDVYLNYYTDELASTYEPLVQEINSVPRDAWRNEAVQKQLEEKRLALSHDLALRKIPHYKMKFTSYFAVKD